MELKKAGLEFYINCLKPYLKICQLFFNKNTIVIN